ncbi:MAG: hypothetical protein II838_03850 [Lachnospiraceae bacterium]|nr:hypothetical protein [Lachnospiraceae bacterium]
MEIVRVFENNMELLVIDTEKKEKDWIFLNCLWQYVLISKNISRTLPKCSYCGNRGEFTFEGFGAIKKVGNGIMYIPDSEGKLYMIPDIIFHYLYMHNMKPTKLFKDMVYSAPKPQTKEYIDIIEKVYYVQDKLQESEKIKCNYCNKKFKGVVVYKQGKNNSMVKIHRQHSLIQRIIGEKYIGLCANCFHLTKI